MTTISNIDLKELAEQFGTPVYVYNADKIRSNYKRLKEAFASVYPDTDIHYSVKANSNIRVLEVFKSIGAGVDCSSPMETILARKAGFADDQILYTGNYESPEDLQTAYAPGVRLNLDDMSSFDRLKKIAIPEMVSFRINPGIGRGGFEGITTAGADAKFGVPYEMAKEAYQAAKNAGVKRFGIHMMTGSNNLEPYYFAEVTEKLMTIAGRIFENLDIVPEYFDIGGGFGVPYDDYEQELNIELTARLVAEAFREKCDKFGFGTPKLLMEPGRYLMANTGYLITQVTGVKKSYKTFVGVDAGMNTLIRPALYGAKHRVEVYGKELKNDFVNLCGQICENSDIFANNIPFPVAEEGDIVVFREAGAYGYVMASNYNNRLRPAEVLIENGKSRLIRRRETPEDILRLYDI